MAQDGRILTEAPLAALERGQREKEAHGEFDSQCPGSGGAQDTFDVGNLKGVGRISQQTCIDTDTQVGFAKLYTETPAILAADWLNDRVVPFFAPYGIPLSRGLTDRGTEDCGAPDRHPDERDLAVDDIDHSRTKTQTPQTHGIGERFTQTRLDECDRVACRQRLSATLEDLQADLDRFLDDDHTNRPHQGRWCYGTTPLHTCLESLELAQETQIASRASRSYSDCQIKSWLSHTDRSREFRRSVCSASIRDADQELEDSRDPCDSASIRDRLFRANR